MRYRLETCFSIRNPKWKKQPVSSNKLADLSSEIVACLNAGDSVRVVDTLRDNIISEGELMRILDIDPSVKRSFV